MSMTDRLTGMRERRQVQEVTQKGRRLTIVFIYHCFFNQGKDLAQNQDPHHIEDPEDQSQGQLIEVHHPSKFLLYKTLLLQVGYEADSS